MLLQLHGRHLQPSAEGGNRTHTPVRALDFESSASANSATSAACTTNFSVASRFYETRCAPTRMRWPWVEPRKTRKTRTKSGSFDELEPIRVLPVFRDST